MTIAPATAASTGYASDLPGRGSKMTWRARAKIWWRELDHVLLGLIERPVVHLKGTPSDDKHNNGPGVGIHAE